MTFFTYQVVEDVKNGDGVQWTLIIVASIAAVGSIVTAAMTRSTRKSNDSDHGFVRDAIETLMSTHVDILHKIDKVDKKVDDVAEHIDARFEDMTEKVGTLSEQFTGHLQSDLDKALRNDKEQP